MVSSKNCLRAFMLTIESAIKTILLFTASTVLVCCDQSHIQDQGE